MALPTYPLFLNASNIFHRHALTNAVKISSTLEKPLVHIGGVILPTPVFFWPTLLTPELRELVITQKLVVSGLSAPLFHSSNSHFMA
jgi:hypothetical protein